MHTKFRFSVLVPSFNAAPFIDTTLRSVADQLGPDDEVVLQDGGSTDGTVDVLRRFCDDDHRFTLVSEQDRGQSDALNRALARASKEFVVWLNADDLVLPGALDALRASLQARPDAALAWGGHRYVAADGAVIEDFLPSRFDHSLFMRRGCYVFSGSIAVDTGTLRRAGGFVTDLHFCMDLDLMLRLEEALQPSQIVHVDAPIGALRWHDASKSGTRAWPFLKEGWQVRGQHMHSAIDRARRLEAFAMLGLAHLTVELRHTPGYRRLRRRVLSRFSAIKTTAPSPSTPRA